MLNVAEFLVACFILLLFVSIYRKRNSASLRFWVVGWFCVLLHFGSLLPRLHPGAGQTAQDIAALSTLIVCGLSFALSDPAIQGSTKRQILAAVLLGVPWLLVMVFGSLPARYLLAASVSAITGDLCLLGFAAWLFREKQARAHATFALVLGCGLWLVVGFKMHAAHTVQASVLTVCFGFNAILLGIGKPRSSTATWITSLGGFAWAAVWVVAAGVQQVLPALAVSPEIWNLPKYLLAAGMVLRLLEEEIRTTELTSEQYRLLFAGNPHPMWIYDRETLAFLEINDAAVAHYGFSRDEFLAMTLLDVLELGDDGESLANLSSPEPQTLSGPWLHRRKDGCEFQVDIASQPVLREGQDATFALMHDVTEPQRLHAQLIRQAHHDVLTGLPNRAFFEHTMESALAEAAATKGKAAVFCIDLDRFKQINDTFGHNAGDRCLQALTRRISARLGQQGTLARTGGDEFMLILSHMEHAEAAERLANQLLLDLKPSVPLERGEVELVASIGFAVYPDDGREGAQLWRDADAAMYCAKRAGGAQWVRVSREISREANEANDLELSLRRALKQGELALHYQPQVTAFGELHSVEALIRFKDALLSRTPAERVVAIAEESGLIAPLGDWVLEEVCRQSREWIDDGLPPVQIAFNVSPLQLSRFNFSVNVASTLERYQLSPRLLEIEVTESTVMPDRGEAPDQIAMLAQMGIHFSVDDFGTGYSSLGRLHQLPVESLKIDRTFTRKIAEKKGTYPTVRAIIALAHTLGLKVVAEGVETQEQLRILRSLECDRMQGYLFSKPLPAGEVRSFLAGSQEALLEAEVA